MTATYRHTYRYVAVRDGPINEPAPTTCNAKQDPIDRKRVAPKSPGAALNLTLHLSLVSQHLSSICKLCFSY